MLGVSVSLVHQSGRNANAFNLGLCHMWKNRYLLYMCPLVTSGGSWRLKFNPSLRRRAL